MAAKKRKRRYAASIGGLFIAMAVLGVSTIIFLCIRLTTTVLDNSKEKQTFEDIIRPVVMFNPAPFEKATDVEMKNLLLYSIWSALMGEKRDTYQFNENSELVVPASDLDVAAKKLFGPDVALEHQTFGEFDSTYFYDAPSASYFVPNTILTSVYTPLVEAITKQGDLFELSVGYVPSGISYKTDFSGGRGQPAPEKYMNYIMQKSKDGYYIAKVQDPEFIAGSQPPPTDIPPAQTPDTPEPSAPESQADGQTESVPESAADSSPDSGVSSEAGDTSGESSSEGSSSESSSDASESGSSSGSSDMYDEPTPELESSSGG